MLFSNGPMVERGAVGGVPAAGILRPLRELSVPPVGIRGGIQGGRDEIELHQGDVMQWASAASQVRRGGSGHLQEGEPEHQELL